MNRRMRTRTYGGVGAGTDHSRSVPATRLDLFVLNWNYSDEFISIGNKVYTMRSQGFFDCIKKFSIC